MRLIDANRLVENIKAYSKIEGTNLSKADGKIIDCIISHIETLEPTVETIPKVKLQEIVEIFEKQAEECRKYWDVFDDEDSFGGMNAYCHAISIVKKVGGMNG